MAVGLVLEGSVTGMNKGGLEVDVHGVRGFIPASQVDFHFMKDISDLIGKRVKVEVTKFERDAENLVLSRRKVLEREAVERKDEMIAQLQIGQTCRGRVRNLADYGAFVELAPGVEGLLHISDMSWGRVEKADSVVSVGQELELQILRINREEGRISLGLKQITANPWEKAAEKYAAQQRLKGRVVRLAAFGAFVELEPGLDGLIPISEMSWSKRFHHSKEVLNEGDVVDVVVLAVDGDKRRISLSLKQIEANPWDAIAERYPPDRFVPAKVARIAEFGAFVEIESGLEGLLHISEISEQRIRTVAEKLQPGQEIQVRVLRFDRETRRISLSMKPPMSAPPPEAAGTAPVTQRKKKAVPRRGGLDIDWGGGGLGSLDPSKYAR
jgi:small subunit ribosomal protein S1